MAGMHMATMGSSRNGLPIDGGGFSVSFNRAGTITGGTYSGSSAWIIPQSATIGDTHWVRATLISETGTPISGTIGAWTQLNANRSWSASAADSRATLLMEVSANSGGSLIVASGFFGVSGSI